MKKHCKFSYNLQFQITLFILVSGQFYKIIIIATTIINIYVCVCVYMYVCMYVYIYIYIYIYINVIVTLFIYFFHQKNGTKSNITTENISDNK